MIKHEEDVNEKKSLEENPGTISKERRLQEETGAMQRGLAGQQSHIVCFNTSTHCSFLYC